MNEAEAIGNNVTEHLKSVFPGYGVEAIFNRKGTFSFGLTTRLGRSDFSRALGLTENYERLEGSEYEWLVPLTFIKGIDRLDLTRKSDQDRVNIFLATKTGMKELFDCELYDISVVGTRMSSKGKECVVIQGLPAEASRALLVGETRKEMVELNRIDYLIVPYADVEHALGRDLIVNGPAKEKS